MRKLLLIFTVLILLVFAITSCNSPESPTENILDFSEEGYRVIYNKDIVYESVAIENFIQKLKSTSGKELPKANYMSKASEYELIFGKATNREEYKVVADVLTRYSTQDISAWGVKVIGKKIMVLGDNEASFKLAVAYLESFITADGLLVPENLDKLVVFDYKNYLATGEVVTYTDAEVAAMSTVSVIAVGDKIINVIDDTFEYTAEAHYLNGYPMVVATPSAKGATVNVTQATADNGGIATVVAKSKDESTTTTYRIVFSVNNEYSVNASVVNKDGKSSAIVFTIDDGDQRTATFMLEEMLVKYPELKATFGLVTKNLATVESEGTPGTESYKWKTDENGRYVYTVNQASYEFWKKIADTGNFALTSHSHTHAYVGADDGGGIFEYEKSDGTKATSKYFAKGNISMELIASIQIIKDLYPSQTVLGYIKPGTGSVNSDYYYDKIINGGFYISARSTAGSYKNPVAMVNTAEWFATWRNRYYVKGYMIQHYTTNAEVATDESSTPEQCMAAGIPAWKNYIDEAVKAGSMACFCIHTIKEDGYVGGGHYIFDSQADELFGYATSLAEAGDAWIALYDEAMIYYNMWSTSEVTATAYKEEKITLSMTHKEVGDMYDNVSLTVKVSVPDSWTSATVNNKQLTVHTDKDGSKYVFADVVKGVDTVVLGN